MSQHWEDRDGRGQAAFLEEIERRDRGQFRCAMCRHFRPVAEIELDRRCRPVCHACYLLDVPLADVDELLARAPHRRVIQ